MEDTLPKLLAIVGPTATGKSDLAVDLALAHDGEVISADSRQIYRGLDIGTGKITHAEMRGVPHYLLDVADPSDSYSVAQYKQDAENAIEDTIARGKLPVLCGGSGQYIDAVVENLAVPEVPPNPELRKALEDKPAEELFEKLLMIDPRRAEMIDRHNPRRLIRAIEIAQTRGSVPELEPAAPTYDSLLIGLDLPTEELRERITSRLAKRIDAGMLDEFKTLHENGLSWERFDSLGLEYRYGAKLLQNELTLDQFKTVLAQKIWQYAKRQRTWFKRNPRIHWFTNPNDRNKIDHLVREWLSVGE